MDPLWLVLTNTSSEDEAQAIAAQAVAAEIAAAAQVIGPVQSVFRWQGEPRGAAEWICLLKTSQKHYPDLEQLIRSLHSYELPAILALPIATGFAPYLAWYAAALHDSETGGE
jgi:periplasmic divalent cation tolerance protein